MSERTTSNSNLFSRREFSAASSSVISTPLMVEVSPTLAKGMISAPAGPTSSRSVGGMSLE